MNTIDVLITTIDNPFSPYTQWDEWYAYDEQRGYCTCGLVAMFVETTNELGEQHETLNVYDAYRRIKNVDLMNLYVLVDSDNNRHEFDELPLSDVDQELYPD